MILGATPIYNKRKMILQVSSCVPDVEGGDWDQLYRQGRHLAEWPWSDLVSLCKRFAQVKEGTRVLELGCGAGANIPFFRSTGAEYWSIEASATIVGQLCEQYPDLRERLLVGDFARAIDAPGQFDLIVDRASITHNGTAGIRKILTMIESRLAPGGRFIGVDWFSTEFSEYAGGTATEDRFTKTGFSGRLADIEVAHFSDENHLKDLLSSFTLLYLEQKSYETCVPASDERYGAWNFVAALK